jgi:hypothetical protein
VIDALFVDDDAMSDARIDAVNCVALTNCVTRATLLIFTVAPFWKFVPFTVSVNPWPPITASFGLIVLIAGSVGDATITVTLFELPTVGVATVIGTLVTAAARSDAATVAVNCVLLTYVVVRLAPFHCTTELVTKLLPFTVTGVAAAPASKTFGDTVVMLGAAGAEIVRLAEACPPPGAGFITAIVTVPVALRSLLATASAARS